MGKAGLGEAQGQGSLGIGTWLVVLGGEGAGVQGLELVRGMENREGVGNAHLLSSCCVPSCVGSSALCEWEVGGGR